VVLLVLCGIDDHDAVRFGHQAGRAGVDCRIVTTEELSYAHRLSHRLGGGAVDTTVELGTAPPLRTGAVSGVLNRMLEPPARMWQQAAPAERDYATMELHAVVLSWLHGLPCPVRNRPEPDSLAGPTRHPFLAAAVAHAVGLRCPTVRFDSETPLGAADALLAAAAAAAGRPARPVHVACLDGQAFTAEAPGDMAEGIAALAAGIGAREALIGVDFVVGATGWWFAGVSPLADLRAGGADLSARLIQLLAPGLARVCR
jgi:hypothetical protein